MGDRVLFQVHNSAKDEISPVVYGHWHASAAPQILAALAEQMKGREGDVQYTAARLVQQICGEDKGHLSVGLWNADKLLTAEESHGDGGCVLIECASAGLKFECFGGYLSASADGFTVQS